mgnify:CR=1 FL=1
MDGLNKIHTNLLANVVNPCFKIPTDEIDDTNILDVVLAFEKAIPEQYRDAIKEIKMNTTNAQNHKLLYEDAFGKNTDYKGDKGNRTRLGERPIIAIPGMANRIAATIDGNLVRMIDVVENPGTITDVQKQDYKLTPGIYVGTEEVEDDGIPYEEKVATISENLKGYFEKSIELQERIKNNLKKVGIEI